MVERRRTLPLLLVLVAGLLAAGCATAGRGAKTSPLDAAVEAASRRCGCRIGMAARHLESGRVYEHDAAESFESASVIKIAILTEAMARVRDGKVSLSDRWTLTEEKKADGSGTLLILDAGLNPTWSDLVTLMIGPSDNTATNAWIDRLGIDAINARMAGMGLPHIHLFTRLPDLSRAHDEPSPWKGFRLGAVTPRELADWMEKVARGELLDPESSRKIFEYLDKDPTRLRIARRFPSEMLWAGKSGSMRGVRNDSGILRTKKGKFVLVVLTDGSKADPTSSADHPSVLAIGDVAKAVVDAWSRSLPDIVEKPR
jgi:beta-lactamase class A